MTLKKTGVIKSYELPLACIASLARACSLEEHPGGEYAESDTHFFWEVALRKLDIPFVTLYREDVKEEEWFCDKPHSISEDVRKQLDGKVAEAALEIEWDGDDYFVASLGTEEYPQLGMVIDARTIRFLHLIRANYSYRPRCKPKTGSPDTP